MTSDASQTIGLLRDRAKHYPIESHPVEYATIQFNLGLALAESLDGDRTENLKESINAYAEALKVFSAGEYPLQRGRVLTALGTVERDLGIRNVARDRFEEATNVLDGLDAPAEIGAANNNLGLTETDLQNYDEAIAAFDNALKAFDAGHYSRQRATTLINRGMAYSRKPDVEYIDLAIADYRLASQMVGPTDASYVFALAHHSLGVALLGKPGSRVEHLGEAIRALDTSLTVFTRSAYPFQHALTKNNLGIAYEEIAPHDPTSLRRALARYEEALMLLDPRIHKDQWFEINANLTRTATKLEVMTGDSSRITHFAELLAATSSPEQLDLLRFRLRSYLTMPEPHRSQALSMLDNEIVSIQGEALNSVTKSWMHVLMEQPHEHLEVGLKTRQGAHDNLAGDQLQAALNATEQALGELEVIQRVRVRDLLTDLGYQRPEPS